MINLSYTINTYRQLVATLNRCVLCLVSLGDFGLICDTTLPIVPCCKRQERSGAMVSVLGS